METRWLDGADAEQIKHVWATCFGDSDAFIDEYFRSAAQYKNGMGCFEDGVLISDLFMLDFNARLSLFDSLAYFLAGCATMPEARNKHLMKKLIKQALLYMEDDGRAVTFLHPFLHSFYRKFGYETVSYVKRFSVGANKKGPYPDIKIAHSFDEVPFDRLFRAYGRYVGRFDNYFVRSTERFAAWLKLLFADGGRVIYIEEGQDTAYALCYEENGKTEFIETVYFTDSQLDALLSCAGGGGLSCFLPAVAGDGGAEEFTMMRVVNPQRVLSNYTYPEDASFVIGIEDPFMEKDVKYAVNVAGGAVDVCPSDAASDIAVDIGQFAVMVSGAYADESNVELRNIFPMRTACYFETY